MVLHCTTDSTALGLIAVLIYCLQNTGGTTLKTLPAT